MDPIEELRKMLEWMARPAFYVENGVIRVANLAAKKRLICENSPLGPLLGACRSEYEAFEAGTLSLTVTVGAEAYLASAERLGSGELFLLSAEQEDEQLRALALAAQQLRLPLNQALCDTGTLSETLEDEQMQTLCGLNRSLYRMLRIVLNMSDAYQNNPRHLELQDVCAVLQEIFDRARELFRESGVRLRFRNLPTGVFSYCDSAMLERAVCNLLSNALRQIRPGETVQAAVTRRNARLYLTVENPGGENRSAAPGAFSRFLREPGLEDSRNGLGLGLRLVQSAAAAHGGTVLMEPLPDGGMRVTMSLAIRQKTDQLRSSPLRIDYAGERDHELIEFAELLPPEYYKP